MKKKIQWFGDIKIILLLFRTKKLPTKEKFLCIMPLSCYLVSFLLSISMDKLLTFYFNPLKMLLYIKGQSVSTSIEESCYFRHFKIGNMLKSVATL